MIRGFPNGETQPSKPRLARFIWQHTRGSETSQYPEEEKITMIPLVVASERGKAQTNSDVGLWISEIG